MSAGNIDVGTVGAATVNGARSYTNVVVRCTAVTVVTVSARPATGGDTIPMGNAGLLRAKVTVDGSGAPEASVIVPWEQDTLVRIDVELIDASGGRTPAGVYNGFAIVTVTIE